MPSDRKPATSADFSDRPLLAEIQVYESPAGWLSFATGSTGTIVAIVFKFVHPKSNKGKSDIIEEYYDWKNPSKYPGGKRVLGNRGIDPGDNNGSYFNTSNLVLRQNGVLKLDWQNGEYLTDILCISRGYGKVESNQLLRAEFTTNRRRKAMIVSDLIQNTGPSPSDQPKGVAARYQPNARTSITKSSSHGDSITLKCNDTDHNYNSSSGLYADSNLKNSNAPRMITAIEGLTSIKAGKYCKVSEEGYFCPMIRGIITEACPKIRTFKEAYRNYINLNANSPGLNHNGTSNLNTESSGRSGTTSYASAKSRNTHSTTHQSHHTTVSDASYASSKTVAPPENHASVLFARAQQERNTCKDLHGNDTELLENLQAASPANSTSKRSYSTSQYRMSSERLSTSSVVPPPPSPKNSNRITTVNSANVPTPSPKNSSIPPKNSIPPIETSEQRKIRKEKEGRGESSKGRATTSTKDYNSSSNSKTKSRSRERREK